MGTYTLFSQQVPTGSGGGAGATTGSYGVQFAVTSPAVMNGIWFYTPPGSTAPLPDSIAVFDTTGSLAVLQGPSWSGVAGSGWIFASFPAPFMLLPGTSYVAAIHQPFNGPNWNITDSTYWSSGAGSGGITSGILTAPNNATAVNGQDTYVAGSTIAFPNTSLAGANIWIDVQVSDAPAGVYSVFEQQPRSSPSTNDNAQYTMGMQASSTVAATATAVWWYSPQFPTPAAALPDTIAIFNVPFQSLVHSEAAVWSGAQGSGWVRAAFSSPVPLNANTGYKAAILKTGSGNNWYASDPLFWSSGPGAGGITNGPLTGVNNAAGDGGQDTFNFGSGLTYPATSFNANNYGVDIEIIATIVNPNGQLGQIGLGVARTNPVRRALWRGVRPVSANATPSALVNGTVPPHIFTARRRAVRAFWRGVKPNAANFTPSTISNGQVQPLVSVSKRRLVRAFWRGVTPAGANFTPSVLINGTVQPRVFVGRRQAAEAFWRGIKPQGANAPPPPNGRVQPQVFVMRRVHVPASWRGIIPVTANGGLGPNPAPAIIVATGPMGLNWVTGPTGLTWLTGPLEL